MHQTYKYFAPYELQIQTQVEPTAKSITCRYHIQWNFCLSGLRIFDANNEPTELSKFIYFVKDMLQDFFLTLTTAGKEQLLYDWLRIINEAPE